MGRKSVTVTVHGGISVVSAFPCGKGASVALEIPLATSIEPDGSPGEFEYIVKSISDRLGGDVNFSISVVSGIPERQGLKSSSALVGSILLAYAAYNNIELDDSEFLKIGSEVSLETSLSATGATDDLAASILGGLCMTDNIHKNLEKRIPVENIPVIIIPGMPGERSSSFGKADFSWLKSVYERMYSILRIDNMELIAVANGYYMGQISGNYLPGALLGGLNHDVCGVNGRGPSVFLVHRNVDNLSKDMNQLRRRNLVPILTHMTNSRAEVVEHDA
ncbi:MAG: hypothetical protein M1414_02100 [Candidatus Thermoplasmatota archaeon]|nr:hypothetical protein [Candidatus Thermoplasmatota archaeon]